MTYTHKLDIIVHRLHAQPRIILGVSCRERVGHDSANYRRTEQLLADVRYRAPFRRSETYEFAGTPVVGLTLTDAELSAGAVLFGVVGLMGLIELVSDRALAFGLTNRQVTATRRTVSGAIGTMSLAIASVASFTLARRYAIIIANVLSSKSD